ncbi:hypothetical protein NL676_029818 [Syzygium grande]|nr:hypothetical protein NL676_029818 [Syzygium grande]
MPLAPHLEDSRLTYANIPLINYIFGLNKLKRLEIVGMASLECVLEECWKSLASLESLCIKRCRWLTSLSKATPPPPLLGTRHQSNQVDLDSLDSEELDLSNYNESSGGKNISELHSLRSVDLVELPKLASLPKGLLYSQESRRLYIRYCWELDICKHESGGNNNLISDFHGGLQNLRSVDLFDLPKLASLPRWLLQANNLEHLEISNCRELDICKDESGNNIILDIHGGLHQSLRSVDIHGLPKLASLPQWLLHASNLEDLSIGFCDELDLCKDESGDIIILDFHGGLHSLRKVTIFGLPKIASLPQWLLQASNLERLSIQSCDELHICKDESGNLLILDFHGGFQNLRSVYISSLPKLASLPRWLLHASNLEDLYR